MSFSTFIESTQHFCPYDHWNPFHECAYCLTDILAAGVQSFLNVCLTEV